MSGQTGDAFNRTAGVDLGKVNGTYGFDRAIRTAKAGQDCITATYATKNGMYIYMPCGVVLWDDISVHYIANADLDENMPNE